MAVASVEDEDVSTALTALVSYDNLIHACAGATGSVVAMSFVYPFDTVRTRLQADDTMTAMAPLAALKKVQQEEGTDALYRGLVPVLTSLCCSNFVYFYAFNGMKATGDIVGIKASSVRDLVFGYVSGCINALVTTPLWVANTRLKLQTKKKHDSGQKTDEENKPRHLNGLVDGVMTIAREDGPQALWNGVGTSFVLSANPAIHFMVYETIKRVFLKRKKSNSLSSLESFTIGGFAKCIATVITYPLQLLQCRQRAAKKKGGVSPSAREIIEEVLKGSGLLGLYKGMESKLYQTVLAAAIMFLTYEKVVVFVHKLFKVKKFK